MLANHIVMIIFYSQLHPINIMFAIFFFVWFHFIHVVRKVHHQYSHVRAFCTVCVCVCVCHCDQVYSPLMDSSVWTQNEGATLYTGLLITSDML